MNAERDQAMWLANRLALSIKETAKVLGISEGHVRKAMPEIPHLYIGARVVIPVDALRDWLRAQAQAEAETGARVVDDILDSLK